MPSTTHPHLLKIAPDHVPRTNPNPPPTCKNASPFKKPNTNTTPALFQDHRASQPGASLVRTIRSIVSVLCVHRTRTWSGRMRVRVCGWGLRECTGTGRRRKGRRDFFLNFSFSSRQLRLTNCLRGLRHPIFLRWRMWLQLPSRLRCPAQVAAGGPAPCFFPHLPSTGAQRGEE